MKFKSNTNDRDCRIFFYGMQALALLLIVPMVALGVIALNGGSISAGELTLGYAVGGAAVDPHLTSYSKAFSQDLGRGVADFLCPRVDTGGVANGQYKIYSSKNDFQTYNTERAIGGETTRIIFGQSDGTYNCKPHGLEIPIDDFEDDIAGDRATLHREAKARTLISTSGLSYQARVNAAAIANAGTMTSGAGVWSNAAKKPIEEIDAEILAIHAATGLLPNRMVIGLAAWAVLKEHANVINRLPGADVANMTLQRLASLLVNPDIEIRLATLTKDTTKFGKGKSGTEMIGGNVLIFYGQDNASEYDPSYMKCFMTGSENIDSVETYRDEKASSDILRVKWTEDIEVTAAECSRNIVLS